jgi:hypothetical protein
MLAPLSFVILHHSSLFQQFCSYNLLLSLTSLTVAIHSNLLLSLISHTSLSTSLPFPFIPLIFQILPLKSTPPSHQFYLYHSFLSLTSFSGTNRFSLSPVLPLPFTPRSHQFYRYHSLLHLPNFAFFLHSSLSPSLKLPFIPPSHQFYRYHSQLPLTSFTVAIYSTLPLSVILHLSLVGLAVTIQSSNLPNVAVKIHSSLSPVLPLLFTTPSHQFYRYHSLLHLPNFAFFIHSSLSPVLPLPFTPPSS